MVNPGLLVLSGFSLVAAAVLVLFPQQLSELNAIMNRTLTNLDGTLMRYRYIVAGLLFLSSYLFFRLSLILPALWG